MKTAFTLPFKWTDTIEFSLWFLQRSSVTSSICSTFSRSCIRLPVSGKCKRTNQAKITSNGGNSEPSSVFPTRPLTSQTQLTEKLPVHTKSVLSALWRHPQRKLSTPHPHPTPGLVSWAFFFKPREGKGQRKYPQNQHTMCGRRRQRTSI